MNAVHYNPFTVDMMNLTISQKAKLLFPEDGDDFTVGGFRKYLKEKSVQDNSEMWSISWGGRFFITAYGNRYERLLDFSTKHEEYLGQCILTHLINKVYTDGFNAEFFYETMIFFFEDNAYISKYH